MDTIIIDNAAVRQRIRTEAPKLVEQLQAAAEKIVATHNSPINDGRTLRFERRNIYDFKVRQIVYPAVTLEVEYDHFKPSINSFCWVTTKGSTPTKAHEKQLLWKIVDNNLVFSEGERQMTVEETAQMLLEPVLSSAKGGD